MKKFISIAAIALCAMLALSCKCNSCKNSESETAATEEPAAVSCCDSSATKACCDSTASATCDKSACENCENKCEENAE